MMPMGNSDRIEADGRSSRGDKRSLEFGLGLVVFVLAALVRAIPLRYVLTPNGVLFMDGDGYSHMWRIWNAVSRSIPLSARDPFVNFPNGGEVLWSPAFDWILALLIRWLHLEQPAAELLCAWVPLVLGALAVALAALIAARTFSLTAGWLTGVLLAILPGSFFYTQFGFLDHHAAVTLIGTAMLAGAMKIVSVEGSSGPRFWPLAAGVLCGFALLIWAGALLHIGVLQVAMLTWALGTSSRDEASTRTLRLALAHAVAAIVILPFSFHVWEVFGDFNPLALTRFQPAWFGAAAICLASVSLSWRIPSLSRTRVRRFSSAVVVGVLGLCLAFATIPQLATTLEQSAGWFNAEDEFLSNIMELQPLFVTRKDPIWLRPTQFLTPLLFLFPLAMIVIGWRSRRPERWLLLFWTAAFCVLTLSQLRFINTFSVAYSIVWGAAIAMLLDQIEKRTATSQKRLIARAFVGILLATALIVPAWSYYAPRLRDGGSAIANLVRQTRIMIARLLAVSRPPTLDAEGNPTEGLLYAWSGGHELRYYSGWAVHQDGFGPYVSPENTKLASRYYEASNEDEAIETLERMGTRYVLADLLGAGQRPYPIESMARRLVDSAGSGREVAIEGSSRRDWLPALTRHRLVFAAPNGSGGAWLYEIVPGAVVVGSAPAGSRVSVEVQLGTPSGHPRTWTTRQRADEAGAFRLRVPYATLDAPSSGFTPLGPYRLRTGRGVAKFDVTEASVQAGEVIRVSVIERRKEDDSSGES